MRIGLAAATLFVLGIAEVAYGNGCPPLATTRDLGVARHAYGFEAATTSSGPKWAIHGVLEIAVRPDGLAVAVVDPARLEVTGEPLPGSRAERFPRELTRPVRLELRADGSVGGVDFSPVQDRGAGYVLSLLVDALQAPLAKLPEVSGSELRADTVMDVRYARPENERESCHVYRKTLQRSAAGAAFGDDAGPAGKWVASVAGTPAISASLRISLEALSGWPKAIDGRESLGEHGREIAFKMTRLPATSAGRLTAGSGIPPRGRTIWGSGDGDGPMPLGYARVQIGDQDLPEIFALARSESFRKRYERDQAFLKVKAFIGAALVLRKGAADRLEGLLRDESADGALFRAGVSALGENGSAAAQAALARIEAARLAAKDSDGQMHAILGMALSAHPNAATEAIFRDRARGAADQDPAIVARLSLGIAADHLARSEPQRSARLVADLTRSFRRATGWERELLAKALGNSGSPSLPGVFKEMLRSASEEERAMAADELRRVDGDEAVRVLLGLLRDDPAPRVRLAAVTALSHERRRSVMQRIEEALPQLAAEKDYDVKRKLLDWLGNYAGEWPRIYDAIERTRHDDPDGRVREQATTILGGKRRILAM